MNAEVSAALGLAPLIEQLRASAAERDRAGGHAATEKALLRDADLLGLSIPTRFSGSEISWRELFALVREIASVDSALAHVLAFHHLQVATVRIFGSEAQQECVLTETARERLWWGNAINPLDQRLVATPQATGFVLNGTKSFCSGIVGSHWLTLSAAATDVSQPLLAFTRTDQPGLSILDDWDPIGQRQTDSNSVHFEHIALPRTDVMRHTNAPMTPFQTLRSCLGQFVLVNLYLGIAQGAVSEAREYAHTRARPWFSSGVAEAVDDPYTLGRFGELGVQLAAGDALVERAARRIDEAFRRGTALTAEERAHVSIAVAEAKVVTHRAGLAASNELFEVTGARGAARLQGLDRFWRNVRTHTLHDPLDYKLNLIGRWVLKGEAPSLTPYT